MNKLFTQFGNPPADRSRQMMRASDALENIRRAKINSDIVQQKGRCIPINQFWAYRPCRQRALCAKPSLAILGWRSRVLWQPLLYLRAGT